MNYLLKNNQIKKRGWVLVMALLLTACAATVPPVRIPETMEPKKGEPSGLVFGTLGVSYPDGFFIEAEKLFFRKIGSKEYGSISYGATRDERVVEDIKEIRSFYGRTFSVQLPVGEYELFQYWAHWHFAYGTTGHARANYSSNKEFSVPFKVEDGKATYLGTFTGYTNMVGGKKSGLLVTYPASVYWVVSDNFDRDAGLLPSALQGEYKNSVIKAIVESHGVNAPFLPFCISCSVEK